MGSGSGFVSGLPPVGSGSGGGAGGDDWGDEYDSAEVEPFEVAGSAESSAGGSTGGSGDSEGWDVLEGDTGFGSEFGEGLSVDVGVDFVDEDLSDFPVSGSSQFGSGGDDWGDEYDSAEVESFEIADSFSSAGGDDWGAGGGNNIKGNEGGNVDAARVPLVEPSPVDAVNVTEKPPANTVNVPPAKPVKPVETSTETFVEPSPAETPSASWDSGGLLFTPSRKREEPALRNFPGETVTEIPGEEEGEEARETRETEAGEGAAAGGGLGHFAELPGAEFVSPVDVDGQTRWEEERETVQAAGGTYVGLYGLDSEEHHDDVSSRREGGVPLPVDGLGAGFTPTVNPNGPGMGWGSQPKPAEVSFEDEDEDEELGELGEAEVGVAVEGEVTSAKTGGRKSGKGGKGKRGKKRRGKLQGMRLTSRDVEIIEFLGRHKMATYQQLAVRFGTSEEALRRRLPRLEENGLLAHAWAAAGRQKLWLPSKEGLKVANMDLPVPTLSWGHLRHDLWLVDIAVQLEVNGEILLGEREVRAAAMRKVPLRPGFGDAGKMPAPTTRMWSALNITPIDPEQPYGGDYDGLAEQGLPVPSNAPNTAKGLDPSAVTIGELAGLDQSQSTAHDVYQNAFSVRVEGHRGYQKVGHIPDIVVLRQPVWDDVSGRERPGHIAVELELTRKSVEAWRKKILAYVNTFQYDKVVYYFANRGLANSFQRLVNECGGQHKISTVVFTPTETAADPYNERK